MPIMTVPNLFTLSRIVLTVLAIGFVAYTNFFAALIAFGGAALTDFFDGYLARRLNQISEFGAILDPIADKFLINGVLISLWIAGMAPAWFMSIVVGRDIIILLGALVIVRASDVRDFPPNEYGKISTFFQMMAITALIILQLTQHNPHIERLSDMIVITSTMLTIVSGIIYTCTGIAMVSDNPKRHA